MNTTRMLVGSYLHDGTYDGRINLNYYFYTRVIDSVNRH